MPDATALPAVAPALAQATIDLDPSGTTPQQTALALSLLVAFAAALIAGSYLIQFAGLDERHTREKKHLLAQKDAQEPQSLILDSIDEIDSRRGEIRGLFDGQPPERDRMTLSAALGLALNEIRESWGNYASRIPNLARWLLELALALSVTAALVHVSAETYRRLFSTGGGQLTLGELVADAGWALEQSITVVGDTIGLFPYAGTLWSLGFAYSLLAAEWIYDHPLPVIALLVGAAAGVIYLDRQAPEARSVDVTRRRPLVVSVLVALPLVWLAGAVPAAVGSALGFSAAGNGLGLVAALALVAVFAYYAGRGVVRRTRATIRLLEDADDLALAYLLVRRLGYVGASLAVPLIPIYLLAAVVSGQVGGIVQAYLAGSLAVQLAVALLGLLALAGVVWLTRGAWGDVRAALRNLGKRTAVRAVLLRRGVPFVVMTVAYLLALGYGQPVIVAVAAALGAGVAARGAYQVYYRLRHTAIEYERRDRTPNQVVVRAYQLETAGGADRYYAEVNDVDLAHDDPDALVDAVAGTARELFDAGEADPRVERAFARDLVRFGIVDREQTLRKLRKDAVRLGDTTIADNDGMIDADTLDEKAREELPNHIWTAVAREMRAKGQWQLRNGYYVRSE